MHSITQGDFERAIYDLMVEMDLEFHGKTNGECIKILESKCTKLHSDDELKEFCSDLMKGIEKEFGHSNMNIWYRCRMQSMFGHPALERKYYALLKDICNFVNSYRESKGIIMTLDVYRAIIFFKDLYRKEYGILDEDSLDNLYSFLNTLKLCGYKENLIDELKDLIEMELTFCGDKYYVKKDLSDKSVLKDLYTEVSEILCKENVYKGHEMFHEYDGYGGVSFII